MLFNACCCCCLPCAHLSFHSYHILTCIDWKRFIGRQFGALCDFMSLRGRSPERQRTPPQSKTKTRATGSVVVRDGRKCRQMGKDGKRYPSNVVKCCSFRAYLSNLRFDVFACLQEHTEREEVQKGARAKEDRKKAEAASGRKQADEEQQQKVTFQTSAVALSQFCAYISRLFFSD